MAELAALRQETAEAYKALIDAAGDEEAFTRARTRFTLLAIRLDDAEKVESDKWHRGAVALQNAMLAAGLPRHGWEAPHG